MKSNKKEYYLFLIVFFVLWLAITVFVMDPNIIRKIKSSISDLVIKDDIVVIKRNTTKEQLMVKSQEFNLKVFSNDIEISNNDIIKTNDRLENNGEEHLIAVLGDVNKDGKVDFSDVSRTYRIFKNIVTVNKVERTAADSNEDNIVNISDASRTYRIFKNLIPDDDTIVTKYTVSFDSDGGTPIDSQQVIGGDIVIKPEDPVKEGYEFLNWTVDGIVYDFNNPVRDNIILKASYRKITNSIEGYFLNTQIDYEEDGKNKFFTSNESLLFKTENGKIIMVDTADNNEQVQNVIINKLREISSSDQIVIDYLLMTHPHGDHFGNLEYIITHPNIRVKNIIYKKENLYKNIENILNKENVLQVINSKNINIIDVSSLNESMHKINLDNVTMTLFNLSDAYKNYTADQCKKTFYAIKFSSSVRDTYENGKVQENIKKDGKYIYLNSLDPDDNTLKYSDTIENVGSDLGLDSNNNPNRRYYAYLDK